MWNWEINPDQNTKIYGNNVRSTGISFNTWKKNQLENIGKNV